MAISTSSLPTALESLAQIHELLRANEGGYYDDAMDTYKFIMGMHLQMLTTASHRGLRDRNGRLYFAVCWTKTKSKLESCGFAVREVDRMFTDPGWGLSTQDLMILEKVKAHVQGKRAMWATSKLVMGVESESGSSSDTGTLVESDGEGCWSSAATDGSSVKRRVEVVEIDIDRWGAVRSNGERVDRPWA